jgi:hypothetical protein
MTDPTQRVEKTLRSASTLQFSHLYLAARYAQCTQRKLNTKIMDNPPFDVSSPNFFRS